MEVTVPDRGDEEEYGRVRDCLAKQGLDFAEIRKISTVFRYGDTEEFVYAISASEEVYPAYIEGTDLRGKTEYTPFENGILVSNRLSEKTGLKTGEEMVVYDEDYQPHTVTAGSVCRNYLGRNLYFSPEDYRRVFGEEPENNTFLVRVEHSARDALREELKGKFPGLDLEYTDEIPDTLRGLKSTYNVIVYLMTALSILLSVFVLLNLVNIFVRRRKNEVIIMAVNGFSWAEQRGYLLKETITTTVFGLLLGVAGGYGMTDFVVRMVESGDSMFVRSFNPKAWLFAAAAESLFALIINAISYRRLKKLKLTDITR
jgi:putative ABC transport system permease protein